MARKMLGRCPVCNGKLDVVKMNCPSCNTSIEGRFEICKFCQLNPEQKEFIEVFIKSRGNIKEVERELGISYPTVRGRLDAVIEALGYRVEERGGEEPAGLRRKEILEALAKGEISSEEAVKQLKQL
ncbi:MAG: DUF2089 domain-containing protein [Bacillota bacterium]